LLITSLKNVGLDFSVFLVDEGEEYKSLETADKIYTYMIKNHFDRDSQVIAFGGGVIGDLAGFVAATYMRGVDFIQIPTTLLAQVDASIGGKVGVNHALGKNMIGAFYQPKIVLSDINLLHTLSRRELSNGLAEVVKYAVIRDADLFNYLEENTFLMRDINEEIMNNIVYRCAGIKADVVMEDERENDARRILNFGHTIGHAIEAAYKYTNVKHGEGVALGMIGAAYLALNRGLIDSGAITRLKNLLVAFNLPTGKNELISEIDFKKVLAFLDSDKKKKSGEFYMVLPTSIGSVVVEKVTKQEIGEAILRCCTGEEEN